MNVKKKRLGRGLDALLSKPATETMAMTDPAAADGLRQIPIDLLQRGRYQPRTDIRQDSLDDLANSINAQGVVQPIIARPVGSGANVQRYEIIAGERRWRAAQLAGLQEVPVVVREMDDRSAIAVALIRPHQADAARGHGST